MYWQDIFQGTKPKRVIIGFVNSKGVTGDYGINPFNFLNCDIRSICLYADGLPVSGNAMKCNFTDKSGIVSAYTKLFEITGKWNRDVGNFITREHFIRGSTLFAFQLEPYDSNSGEYMTLSKTGNVKLEVNFGTVLPQTTSCIVYSESPGYFEINKERDIIVTET